jgi:hypothetical protein
VVPMPVSRQGYTMSSPCVLAEGSGRKILFALLRFTRSITYAIELGDQAARIRRTCSLTQRTRHDAKPPAAVVSAPVPWSRLAATGPVKMKRSKHVANGPALPGLRATKSDWQREITEPSRSFYGFVTIPRGSSRTHAADHHCTREGAMDINHPSARSSPGKPGPIPFSLTLPHHQTLEGTIAISPYVGDPHIVAIELQLAGIRPGSAALTDESALDLALRLVGTVMKRRKAARVRSTAPRSSMCHRLPAWLGTPRRRGRRSPVGRARTPWVPARRSGTGRARARSAGGTRSPAGCGRGGWRLPIVARAPAGSPCEPRWPMQ